MQKKKGISLIVLVITMIVMIILAATIMIALSNNGVLGRAEEAVDVTNIKQVETLAQTAWSEAYLYYKEKAEIATREKLETKVNEILAKSNVNLSKYNIEVTEQGVIVREKFGEIKPGLYETSSNYTKLKTSWEELIDSGVIHMTDEGVVYTNFNLETLVNSSSDALVGDLVLPSSVKALGDADDTGMGNMAFAMCTGLTGIKIPSSLTRIGVGAFIMCTSLKNVDFAPDIRLSYGRLCGTFQHCSSLEAVTLPYGVTNIDGYLFEACASLKSVVIPSTVVDIQDDIFCNCNSLTNVYYTGTEEQWLAIPKHQGNEWLAVRNIVTYNYVMQ